MTVLVTGAAGFVGFHVAKALLQRGAKVVGVDNLNSYYDPALKHARLRQLTPLAGFTFNEVDVADRAGMTALVDAYPDIKEIVHLAAQAGVRYSLVDPYAYVTANVMGHVTVLEAARRLQSLRHLVYASSSSVYGGNTKLPFAEGDPVDTPVSLYAATKRADELISHAYAHLHGLPQTGLRFFTVYGPWGRPDMAYYAFAEAILAGQPITLYEGGTLRRDFTYIDDVVDGVLRCLACPPSGPVPAQVLNIGNNGSEEVSRLVALLEAALGQKALLKLVPRPATDVGETHADLTRVAAKVGFSPCTRLEDGIPRFAAWFMEFRKAAKKAVDATPARA